MAKLFEHELGTNIRGLEVKVVSFEGEDGTEHHATAIKSPEGGWVTLSMKDTEELAGSLFQIIEWYAVKEVDVYV